MAFLVDTNLLLRSADRRSSLYGTAVGALSTLRRRGEELYITPQNIVEFWNVYTRPLERNGLGHTAIEAEAEVNCLKGLFPLLLDTPSIYAEWERLVTTYTVVGVNVHDTRLVAVMLVNGLTHILTFNIQDFNRYSEITAVNPTDIT